MTTSLQQLLHDLYNHIMIPEEKNVVSLANRIIDAKQALAKQEAKLQEDMSYHGRYVPPTNGETDASIRRISITSSDNGEIY